VSKSDAPGEGGYASKLYICSACEIKPGSGRIPDRSSSILLKLARMSIKTKGCVGEHELDITFYFFLELDITFYC
jgi:hypothetical protein